MNNNITMEKIFDFLANDWKKELVCSQCENRGHYIEMGKPYFCTCRIGQENYEKVENEMWDYDER